MYLTHKEYQEMGGTLDETAFDIYGYEAYQKIKTATFDRITVPSDAVKRCMMRLISFAQMSDIGTVRAASFSHDGLSQSFNIPKEEEYEKKSRAIIRDYLINETAEDGTPLMYCGVKYV